MFKFKQEDMNEYWFFSIMDNVDGKLRLSVNYL